MTLTYGSAAIISPEFLNPEMARALRVLLETAPPEAEVVVVTSAYRDGDHGKHGEGMAVDLDGVWDRSVNLSSGEDTVVLAAWASRAQARLGADFDVIAHGPLWHIHAEYDPKERKPVSAGYYARVRQARTGVVT